MNFYTTLSPRQAIKIALTLPNLKQLPEQFDDLDDASRDAMITFGLNLPTRDDGSKAANKMLRRCEYNVKMIKSAYKLIHKQKAN